MQLEKCTDVTCGGVVEVGSCTVCGNTVDSGMLLNLKDTTIDPLSGEKLPEEPKEFCPDCRIENKSKRRFCNGCAYDFVEKKPAKCALQEEAATASNESRSMNPEKLYALVEIDPTIYAPILLQHEELALSNSNLPPLPAPPLREQEAGKLYPLEIGDNLVGRNTETSLVAKIVPLGDDRAVSRSHGKIVLDSEGNLRFFDTSSGGTHLKHKAEPLVQVKGDVHLALGDALLFGLWTRITIVNENNRGV